MKFKFAPLFILIIQFLSLFPCSYSFWIFSTSNSTATTEGPVKPAIRSASSSESSKRNQNSFLGGSISNNDNNVENKYNPNFQAQNEFKPQSSFQPDSNNNNNQNYHPNVQEFVKCPNPASHTFKCDCPKPPPCASLQQNSDILHSLKRFISHLVFSWPFFLICIMAVGVYLVKKSGKVWLTNIGAHFGAMRTAVENQQPLNQVASNNQTTRA